MMPYFHLRDDVEFLGRWVLAPEPLERDDVPSGRTIVATIETHANRILRPRIFSDGISHGLDRYFAFGHGSKPCWWNDENPPVTGRIVGVYENCKDSAQDALVLTDHGLTVLRETDAKSFRFEDVVQLMLPEKKPLSLSLYIHLHPGARFEIPVYEPPGVAFVFFRFLRSAIAESRRNASL